MRTVVTGDHTVNHWRDVNELFSAALAPCKLGDTYRASVTSNGELPTLLESVTLARRGWRDGAKAIEKLRATIASSFDGSVAQVEPTYDVTGDYFDIGRVLDGEPECFATLVDNGLRNRTQIAQIVRVVINIAVSGAIGAETVLRRGAAAIVMVDTLERHGIRCQIDVVDVSANSMKPDSATYENAVTVKADNEPMSIDKMAFLIGHVATLRRLLFSIAEHEPDTLRKRFGLGKDCGSYGLPGHASDRGDIYIDRIISPSDWGDDFTLVWLQRTLEAQGITLESKV